MNKSSSIIKLADLMARSVRGLTDGEEIVIKMDPETVRDLVVQALLEYNQLRRHHDHV